MNVLTRWDMPRRLAPLLAAVLLVLAACGTEPGGATSTAPTSIPATTTSSTVATSSTTTTIQPEAKTVTLLAHDSFAAGVSDETFAAFTEETGIEVEVLAAGDAGSMVNQAILTKDNPLADLLFGVDDTFLFRAIDEGIFTPYESSGLDAVPDQFELDPEHRVTPIDFGDVCVNYDKSVFSGDLRNPFNLEQLANPEYRDMLVVEHPATSSPGLAFLLSTIAVFGEDGWHDYWRSLIDNGVEVVSDWDTAYYSEASWYGGDRPLVVSYASSPPAEVIFSAEPIEEAPTGVIDEGCYRQIEFAGVLAGSENAAAAEALIDFMLTVEFQETIPLTWFVYPANENAELPPVFVEHTIVPAAPLRIDPEAIDANRERWIDEWVEIFEG
ncbi:MAG: thiamine ABC transporter substrate-binding protein [Acidimicrobiia bacterium]